MKIAREEIFGPVLVAMPYDDLVDHDAHLWTHNEDPLATTYRDFLDRDKAFAAAGLEPR